MFTLILDTSTEKGIVAVAEREKVLFEEFLNLQAVKGSTLLFSVIQKGLDKLKISIDDLKAIAVAVGPGSFTGIRVAAATAQGIAFPKSLPLIGFSSFTGYISKEEGAFLSLIDAKIGGAYIQMRENRGGEIVDEAPKLVSFKNIPLSQKIVSPSFGKLQISGLEIFPDSSYLAKVIENKYLNNEFSRDNLSLEYLQNSLHNSLS